MDHARAHLGSKDMRRRECQGKKTLVGSRRQTVDRTWAKLSGDTLYKSRYNLFTGTIPIDFSDQNKQIGALLVEQIEWTDVQEVAGSSGTSITNH